jgi:multidrug resistance efflux pump
MLVTAVLVEPNVLVKKGAPLFQFDRRPYEYKVRQLQAQLAAAKQNVRVLAADVEAATSKVRRHQAQLAAAKQNVRVLAADVELDAQRVAQADARLAAAKQNVRMLAADVDVARQKVARVTSELAFARYQEQLALDLATKGAGPEEEAQKATAQLKATEAAVKERRRSWSGRACTTPRRSTG